MIMLADTLPWAAHHMQEEEVRRSNEIALTYEMMRAKSSECLAMLL
jgi:hypothetical protein